MTAGLARCRFHQNDAPGASQLVADVWSYLEDHDTASMEFPIMSYLTCAEIFSAAGDGDRSTAAIKQGHRYLLSQAKRIIDPEWRNSFLENIAEHRNIREKYHQLV